MTITITTPLYYVNDKPHLGSTYTTIASDTYARYQRLKGNQVSFITGVDEHGQKIQRTASSRKLQPIEHCNIVTKEYIELWKRWSISNNHFVRTTSSHHKKLVSEFFHRVNKSGDIRMGRQTGWYCVGCEEYKEVNPSEVSPVCPIHQKDLEWRDEENLFFCLSNYQDQIEKLVLTNNFIEPTSRKNEIINFVSKGLKDFSISRTNVDWGISVPGHKGHTFYVWFDALLGYISAIIPEGKEANLDDLHQFGWPANVHIIGKDILRFHAIYWPAMLISAGLEVPKKIFGHGFLTREGQKMGKSLGNVLDPQSLLDQYGQDPIRWYLLSDIKFGSDGDFQEKRFIDIVNNDLANIIGNLLNRSVTMSRNWFDNSVPKTLDNQINNELKILSIETINKVSSFYESFLFSEACKSIIELASAANLYLNNNQPWKLIKNIENKDLVASQIYNVLETTRIVSLLMTPILPRFSSSIHKQLGIAKTSLLWSDDLQWGRLVKGSSLPTAQPIIEKLDHH